MDGRRLDDLVNVRNWDRYPRERSLGFLDRTERCAVQILGRLEGSIERLTLNNRKEGSLTHHIQGSQDLRWGANRSSTSASVTRKLAHTAFTDWTSIDCFLMDKVSGEARSVGGRGGEGGESWETHCTAAASTTTTGSPQSLSRPKMHKSVEQKL
ncbi:unnamed protein product [Mesocestoides corti]|uniref:Uncharacterized protein n=2 Tax=Mesocestoides corti TaxID=53468 RepID=A0A0R3UP17_MESCO|nr:unnamed protein product [Mesocestoides corti]